MNPWAVKTLRIGDDHDCGQFCLSGYLQVLRELLPPGHEGALEADYDD